jgi:hypothetical protein
MTNKEFKFDFLKKNSSEFDDFLEKILSDLYEEDMKNSWGRNINSFIDLYGAPRDRKHLITLKNTDKVKDLNFKNWIEEVFVNEVLNHLKSSSPNFDYRIMN